MESIYSISVTSEGGRNGHVRSIDGLIDEDVRLPKSQGGPDGPHLTPETFFAAGYSACFNSALMYMIRLERAKTGPTIVTAEVSLLTDEGGGHKLAVKLSAQIPGIDKDAAEVLLHKAHAICPYSKATRNNIEVTLEVI